MFPLLGKLYVAFKAMCFRKWQIYFDYLENSFYRQNYVFPLEGIMFSLLGKNAQICVPINQ